MNEDLEQLLQNLKLKTIAARFDEMLAAAEAERHPGPDALRPVAARRVARPSGTGPRRRASTAQTSRKTGRSSPSPSKCKKASRNARSAPSPNSSSSPRPKTSSSSAKPASAKPGLMVSLARKAVQNGYRALFIKAQDLLDEMYASLADRSTRRLLKSLANVDVLAIDELGYVNIKPEQTNIFFKLMEERHHRKPTLITTNLPYRDLARLPRQSGADQGALESSARALPHGHHRRPLYPPADRLIESIAPVHHGSSAPSHCAPSPRPIL